MKQIIFCLCALLFCAQTMYAQWYKGMLSSKALNAEVLESSIARSVLRHMPGTPAAVSQVERAVFRLREQNFFSRVTYPDGTGFVLEEEYQGKRYLWGVTTSHYLFERPAIKLPDRFFTIYVPFEIQGSIGKNDISVFRIPPQIADKVTALKLAPKEAKMGEHVFSVGYWNRKIHVDQDRVITQITPTKMETTLDIDKETVREGTCGSPVLNRKGEVVGVHAGNSPVRQVGFVLPARYIRQALEAYHHNGVLEEELVFNGKSLGPININERIIKIEAYQEGKMLRRVTVYLRRKQTDYAHLEKLIDTSDADRVVLEIERNPISSHKLDQRFHSFLITYDLKTGDVFHSPLGSYLIPRY